MSEEPTGPVNEEERKVKVTTNYPGNSHKERDQKKVVREEKTEKVKVEKIISGEAVKRKKPLGKKIAETFGGDDMHSVGNYILMDVLLPAAKNMVADAVTQGVERMIFGDSRRRNVSTGSRVNYTSYSSNKNSDKPSYSGGSMSRSISQRARTVHDFDEVILQDRGEAEQVLDMLGEMIASYDVATVSDLYDLVGITGSFTDDKWGWTDLRGASISRVRDGYLLNLPRTQPLD